MRSRAKLDYEEVQRDVDAGTRARVGRACCREIGKLLVDAGLDRGAVNLPMPEQEIEPDGDGWRLVLRGPVPVEEYNAADFAADREAAAQIMLPAGSGCCGPCRRRRQDAVRRLRMAAAALRIDWPDGSRSVRCMAAAATRWNRAPPRSSTQAAEMMRGAGYTPSTVRCPSSRCTVPWRPRTPT